MINRSEAFIGKYVIAIWMMVQSPDILAQNKSLDEERGDAYFSIGKYNSALVYYQRGLKKDNGQNVLYKMSICMLKTGRIQDALLYFDKLKKTYKLSQTQWVEYADLLKRSQKYAHAKKVYLALLKNNPEKYYENQASICDSALKWKLLVQKNLVKNHRSINSVYSEIAPFPLGKDTIIFASNRKNPFFDNTKFGEEAPFYDLYMSVNAEAKWSKPNKFSRLIPTKSHESSACFTNGNRKLYFTQNKPYENEKSDKVEHLKLFYMEYMEGKWDNPHEFYINDSIYSFAHPFATPKDDKFFFVSDMPGGLGGTDIYVCLKKDGLWTSPINLGNTINTEGNETFPFYVESSKTIFFSSDGHPGMGGYDVFKSKIENGEWQPAINLKPPINSSSDDFSLTFIFNSNSGYFSSNRPGGSGFEDIYFFEGLDN